MRLGRPLAVAALAAGTLAYQILLVRVFAIAHFHHFAYMAIGVAMLGFGAAGTWLALARPTAPAVTERGFRAAALVTAATLIASPAAALRIPLEPTRLAWDGGQWLLLAAVYVILAVPFMAGALANLTALVLEPARTGALYGAGFLGAGGGALTGLAVLGFAAPERALALPSVLAALGAIVAMRASGGAAGRWVAVALLAVAVGAMVRPPWRLSITPFKGLIQVEAFPGARRVAERASPVGWVVAVAAPAFRHAPGLSLGYHGAFPEQVGVFVDGDLAGATADWGAAGNAQELLEWLPSALAYAGGQRHRVLVIGAGGGMPVWMAAAHGARDVTAVELSPDVIHLATAGGGDPPGTAVRWVAGDARGYIARAAAAFDLIALDVGGAPGASAAGVQGLNEDFLHTVEAYTTYLRRLAPGGVLAITRWRTVPPRESVRVILTATEALRRVGATPRSALVVARSWGTVTVLVKPDGFERRELAALVGWAADRRFDIDWQPGLTAPVAGFNRLEQPTLFRAARAAVADPDSATAFAATYAFDVAPVSDARPYPHHYLRAASLGTFVGSDRGAWLPFAEWGLVALVATLGQSVVVAALLLVLPVVLRRASPARATGARIVAYFAAIGLAYLAVEIAAIQQLGLLLGHPVYAVTAVLAVLLIGSGIGSVWSDRLAATWGWRVAVMLCGGLLLYATLLLGVVHRLHAAPLWVRAAVTLPLLAPLACAMGMPFALGVRSLVGSDRPGLAWAWAANGFASVVAAPLAALVALELGSPTLFIAGAGGYAVAAVLARPRATPS